MQPGSTGREDATGGRGGASRPYLALPRLAPRSGEVVRIAAMGGDGIGPEVVAATVRCLRALGLPIEIAEPLHGSAAIAEGKTGLPAESRAILERCDAVLFGATDTEKGGAVPVLRYLRFESECFANIRPSYPLDGVAHRIGSARTDFVVVRELTEDMYPGKEGDLAEWSEPLAGFRDALKRPLPREGTFALRVITPQAVERVARYAARLARARREAGHPGHVTIVTKRNVLRRTDGLFEDLSREVIAAEAPEIELRSLLIDDACRRVVASPDQFDVVLTSNLFGDIITDIAAEVMGGITLAPSASVGTNLAYFESCHGSAPDIAGRGIANPTATMLSAAMMLGYLGFEEAERRLHGAVVDALRRGPPTRDRGGTASTDEFTGAVMERLS